GFSNRMYRRKHHRIRGGKGSMVDPHGIVEAVFANVKFTAVGFIYIQHPGVKHFARRGGTFNSRAIIFYLKIQVNRIACYIVNLYANSVSLPVAYIQYAIPSSGLRIDRVEVAG